MNDTVKGMLAGGFCGMTECTVVQPFDMLKTRFQLQHGTNPSLVNAFREVYREGGIKRFYRGMLPEMSSMVPKNSAMYGSYDFAKRHLQSKMGRPGMDVEFLSALFCSVPEAVTVTPFQVVKVRLQSSEFLSRYRNTFHALTTIMKQEGPLALYVGLTVTICRNSVWNGVYFPTMFWIRHHVLPETEADTFVHHCKTLGAGFLGGSFATCFNAPFDVAKSRMQLQVMGEQAKYTSVLPTLLSIAREEGIRALYKGFQPKLLRMGIGGGVAMASYETAMNMLTP